VGKKCQKEETIMNRKKTILITGGAGFIGSHVVRRFVRNYPDYLVVNADKLTYAGNLENISDIEKESNYIFEKTDIVDKQAVSKLFLKYGFDGVIHLAAESHVDRSITNPYEFFLTPPFTTGRKTLKVSSSITSPLMKYMVHLEVKECSPKRQLTIQRVHIPPQRQAPIIL
jgi:UDP-glucose 4-epimerase